MARRTTGRVLDQQCNAVLTEAVNPKAFELSAGQTRGRSRFEQREDYAQIPRGRMLNSWTTRRKTKTNSQAMHWRFRLDLCSWRATR
jgi:hypothetical protein